MTDTPRIPASAGDGGSGKLHRVFFNGNDRAGINRYGLWFDKSRSDLEKLGNDLREGLRVVIYEPGELEMQAVLSFDEEWQVWVAEGDESTIIDYY